MKNKAKEMFASFKDADAFCFTSDGSPFDAKDKSFADSHSQKLEDKTITVIGKNEKFKEENAKLFTEGSKWIFQLVTEIVEDFEHKTRGLNNVEKKSLKLAKEAKSKN